MAEERLIRINKILRELNLSLDRAVEYLKEKDIHIESSPNAKLSQEEYKILCNQFSPDKGKMMASIELSKELNEKKITVNISKSEIQSKDVNRQQKVD